MDLHDLNIFATTARVGSITRAADSLATVQSNVTTRIRLLEQELGTKLFHRNHSGVTLTRKGEELLPYAHQMLALALKAKETVVEKQEVAGPLRIGSSQTTAAVRLPGLLKSYLDRYPQVDVAVETGIAAEMIARVREGSVEGAFVAGHPPHPDLTEVLAFVEEVVIVTPLAYASVDEYLAKCAIPKVLVFKVGCFYRQKLERFLVREGVDRLTEMEFGTLDGIIGCVGAGLGMTLLPLSVIERSRLRDDVRVHPLPREASYTETVFVTHRAMARSSALERLIDQIVEERTAAGTLLESA